MRDGGHIELIRFKEYYGIPRGHEHFSFVFLSALGTFFFKVFLELDSDGKKDPCAVLFGCNNDRLFPEKYTVKDRVSITKLEKGDHYYIQQGTKIFFPITILFNFCQLLKNNESHRKWVTLYTIQSFP